MEGHSEHSTVHTESAGVLAIDIGGHHFRLGIFDPQGRRLHTSEGTTDAEGGRDWMLREICASAQNLIGRAAYRIQSCGISFGGPVDSERQRVSSMHVPGWRDFDLAGWVMENLNLACKVDNDANAGALGEFRFGAGRGIRSMVYITISTGIGGGVLIDGKLLHGRDSLAGEIGHIPIAETGAACSCGGTGCLESMCSGTAIARQARSLAERNPNAWARAVELASGAAGGITAQTVFQAASEGEPAAVEMIQEMTHWLARGLLTVIRIVDPDRVVLGGGVAGAGRLLLDPLQRNLKRLSTPSLSYSTEIVLARLGNYSPLYGAAALALDLP